MSLNDQKLEVDLSQDRPIGPSSRNGQKIYGKAVRCTFSS
jgi:hypothetical protein